MIVKLILLLLTTWIAEGSPAAVPEDTEQVKETPADQPVVSVFFLQRVDNETVGILLSEIEKRIQDHDPASINLFISSMGGDVNAAMAAYHYLRSLPVPLQTYNLATVSSSANLVYCAGDKRYQGPEDSLTELLEVGAVLLPVEAKSRGLVGEIISRRPGSAFEFVLNISPG